MSRPSLKCFCACVRVPGSFSSTSWSCMHRWHDLYRAGCHAEAWAALADFQLPHTLVACITMKRRKALKGCVHNATLSPALPCCAGVPAHLPGPGGLRALFRGCRARLCHLPGHPAQTNGEHATSSAAVLQSLCQSMPTPAALRQPDCVKGQRQFGWTSCSL